MTCLVINLQATAENQAGRRKTDLQLLVGCVVHWLERWSLTGVLLLLLLLLLSSRAEMSAFERTYYTYRISYRSAV